jgi:2-polyprenyl-3-methyl-5-hydroxy-6-metoxy-1,4-benzoquinol methylase
MNERADSSYKQHAVRFQDQSVVDRYHLRPTYPPEIFPLLGDLIVDEPRVALDIGCGTGNIARFLVDFVERVDAVDWSAPMLERARTLPGGDSPKIRWLHGRAEDVETRPPYALVTAGESLHWMDWDVIMPRLAREVTPHGMLAIAYVEVLQSPWHEGVEELRRRFTTNTSSTPFDWKGWKGDLATRGLFDPLGERQAAPVAMRQTVADYVAAQHARSSFSLEVMDAAKAVQFDTEMRMLLEPFASDGALTFNVVGGFTWGKPRSGAPTAI